MKNKNKNIQNCNLILILILILIPNRLSISYSKLIWILTRISLNADSGRKLASEPTCTRATDDSFRPKTTKEAPYLLSIFQFPMKRRELRGDCHVEEGGCWVTRGGVQAGTPPQPEGLWDP